MRTAIPLDSGLLHFVGIGGIGMSGIAEILHSSGYSVQGSDAVESANVQRLQRKGITVHIGQQEQNIDGASIVVISSAITADNPEVAAARAQRIPVVRRAEILAELVRLKWGVAIAGSHGKTTTTTLVGSVLEAASFDPTVINGGIINAYNSNTRMGDGEWVVVEADESDGTFLRLLPTVAIITNIDPEHLEYYGNVNALHQAFMTFAESVPFYGAAVLCLDHPVLQGMVPQLSERKVITYGFSPQADVRGDNLRFDGTASRVDVTVFDTLHEDVCVPMLGRHNVQNALAAIATATHLGIEPAVWRQGLSNYAGVNRRFTIVGTAHGATIVDDYAHHPVEIQAALSTARQITSGAVHAVIQPHRYSRLQGLWNEFATAAFDADTVTILPVYSAGEKPVEGISNTTLAQAMTAHGHKNAIALDSRDELPARLAGLIREHDYVICMGAGNITTATHALPAALLLQRRPSNAA